MLSHYHPCLCCSIRPDDPEWFGGATGAGGGDPLPQYADERGETLHRRPPRAAAQQNQSGAGASHTTDTGTLELLCVFYQVHGQHSIFILMKQKTESQIQHKMTKWVTLCSDLSQLVQLHMFSGYSCSSART